MLVSDKKLRALYKAMSAEVKGPATINYILALDSHLAETRMEVDALRSVKAVFGSVPIKVARASLGPAPTKLRDE